MSKILVAAPHPDDETLGCGGTLLRHVADGDEVHWLIVTNVSAEFGFSEEKVASRQDEIRRVADAYGFAGVHDLSLRPGSLDVLGQGELIGKISAVVRSVQPDTIYVPYCYDSHNDHEAVYMAMMSCSKSFRYPFVRTVRSYETPSETDFDQRPSSDAFKPNLFMETTSFLERKIEILRIYASELGKHPFPRSEEMIRALAVLRGAAAGVQSAEAFMVIKQTMVETGS